MSRFESDYLQLVEDTISFGYTKDSRAGPTRMVPGQRLCIHELREGHFPILTTRQMFPRPIMGELVCFLKGTQKLQDFIDAGCNYWIPNAKAWPRNAGLELSKMSVGRVYGTQWRFWYPSTDQLDLLIKGIRKDPSSRRHIVTAWQPNEIDDMCLPPCHMMFQCHVVGGELHMTVTMRSVDLCVGLPTDIVLYATLLLLLANDTELSPGSLIFLMGDTHVYENHIDLALQQCERRPGNLPTYLLPGGINSFNPDSLILTGYDHEPKVPYAFNL